VTATVQPYAVVTALAVLWLIAGDQDDGDAAPLARRAAAIAEARGVSFEPLRRSGSWGSCGCSPRNSFV
jgi:hypothetical protein